MKHRTFVERMIQAAIVLMFLIPPVTVGLLLFVVWILVRAYLAYVGS